MRTLVLLGPTAVGKTSLAIELAKELSGEIISADSMQVYRGMDIGTAKPSIEERQGIPHHLIDVRNPDEEWTVSDFVEESQKLKVKIQNNGKLPIIVGGTGLYLWSLLEGFSFPLTPADPALRTKLEQQGSSILYSQLGKVDPASTAKIHANDKKRIIRALEVFELTGKPISELQERRTESVERRTEGYLLIGLDLPRPELYARINERVDQMMLAGLVDEVKGLLANGYDKALNSFQALGYKEVVDYLAGRWDHRTMVEEVKKRTRHFARRQMTWFRRFPDARWFPPDAKSAIIELCHAPDSRK
ncbi:MAG: tRNA (adenosine(37)-N6)-dimethylallyltransferase MiaA [Candidatus Margulisbacteria bacterium]|nr:tRNA (adenosine(37)-N6)-dimethylallyltransferase MiaA [Candidatus Margulisiibacteriota bacterium]